MVNHYAEMDEEDKEIYDKMKEELVVSIISPVSGKPKYEGGLEGSCTAVSGGDNVAGQLSNQRKALQENVIDAKNAAVLCGKLLQLSNGAIYTEDHEIVYIHDRKLDLLEELIEEANGQNVLVAYWFQHDRSRIRQRFPEARDLKTEQDIADWNEGKIQLALISPASAGHGLNIQKGGHILIWFSLIWSLEMYQQTNARLWRQGQ